MGIRDQIRGFVRAFRRGDTPRPGRHKGHAIARTFRDGTTISGNGAPGAGMGNVANSRSNDLFVEASERYDASFDDH